MSKITKIIDEWEKQTKTKQKQKQKQKAKQTNTGGKDNGWGQNLEWKGNS